MLRVALGVSALGAMITMAGVAGAQMPAPSTPPPAPASAPPPSAPPPAAPVYTYPPPPPPGYVAYPAPGYGPPPTYRAPAAVAYEGGPIPPGYHLETRARRGLVIAGAVVTGVPWALSVTFAGGSDFPNHSGWLLVPGLGPWLTLLTRNQTRDCSSSSSSSNDGDVCDAGIKTLLILDGLMQTAGSIMFIAGVASPKTLVVRDFVGSNLNLHFNPAPIGRHGYGAVLSGSF